MDKTTQVYKTIVMSFMFLFNQPDESILDYYESKQIVQRTRKKKDRELTAFVVGLDATSPKMLLRVSSVFNGGR